MPTDLTTQVTVDVLCGLFGLLVGSFVNVVIWRVPRGESLMWPGSHCPTCGADIAARDNVPVLSWLLLRGRCRHGGCRIRARYPVVELATGLVWLVLAVRLGPGLDLLGFLFLGAAGVALAVIDLDVRKLPRSIIYPTYGVGVAALGLQALVSHSGTPFVRALLGMVALFGCYFALAFAYPAGMGFGDVRLAGVLGLYTGWIGWGTWLVGLFAGFFLGGIVGLALLAAGRVGRKDAVPFGPFMLVGALGAVLVGDPLLRAYLALTVH